MEGKEGEQKRILNYFCLILLYATDIGTKRKYCVLNTPYTSLNSINIQQNCVRLEKQTHNNRYLNYSSESV